MTKERDSEEKKRNKRKKETLEKRLERQRKDRNNHRERYKSVRQQIDVEYEILDREREQLRVMIESFEKNDTQKSIDTEHIIIREYRRKALHLEKMTQAMREKRRRGCIDKIEYFDENLYHISHTLSRISLFQSLECIFCGAYRWKEERKGFCCSNGRVDLHNYW